MDWAAENQGKFGNNGKSPMYHIPRISHQILSNDEKNRNLLILLELCKYLACIFLTFDIFKKRRALLTVCKIQLEGQTVYSPCCDEGLFHPDIRGCRTGMRSLFYEVLQVSYGEGKNKKVAFVSFFLQISSLCILSLGLTEVNQGGTSFGLVKG